MDGPDGTQFTRLRSTTGLHLSRVASVSIHLCALFIAPVPQLFGLTRAESVESERPVQEEGEYSEREFIFWISARHRLSHRLSRERSRPCETIGPRDVIAFRSGHRAAIVGHRLTNDLRAPLMT